MGRITLQGFECERCGHKWVPREEGNPRVCPRCKSPYWDIPRKTPDYTIAAKSKRKAN